MKRERSDSITADGDLISGVDLNEQSATESNDAEIAEIVDVISNDSLLSGEISLGFDPLPLTLLPIIEDRKIKHAKRPKPDHVLPKINYNLICDRLVGTLHMPLQTPKMGKDRKDTRSTCGICGSKTTIKCSHCGVGMCIADRDGRNCWREFHTRQVLEFKQQPKTERKEKARAISSSFPEPLLLLNNHHQELHILNNSSSGGQGDSDGMV